MAQTAVEQETLLLKQPGISATEVAFLYAGDIWIIKRDGSQPRRLTAQKGRKAAPMFSPDGEWIAFSANYDGNTSVYVLPRQGGSPRRLTYHPYEDWVRGWTPDGAQVLFASARDSTTLASRRLFTVPVAGGLPEVLPMGMAERGAYSPDGAFLAYTPPCWLGEEVYFLSDRSHTMNVFRWKAGHTAVEQVTFHTDFDVRSLTAGGGCWPTRRPANCTCTTRQPGRPPACRSRLWPTCLIPGRII